ncbi:DUF11 domain-containing protein [Actinomadura logoneensis]|nr:DUF11 domain-containing protein [Actinomadura logoneensis]
MPASEDLGLGEVQRTAGNVVLAYNAPKVAQAGSTVSWKWTVRNTGDKAVDDVVLVQRITPQLKVGKMPGECKALKAEIRCAYSTLQAGATASGELSAAIPSSATGAVRIDGKATWREGQAKPQAADPSTPDQGDASTPGQTGASPSGQTGATAPTVSDVPDAGPQ